MVGGAYGEADEPLRPVESVLWQFRQGEQTYRRLIDDRTTETLARRRFGLYPQLPQIARRFGFRYALHLGFDDGRFPVPPEAKRLWEAPDGSQLEALTRPPIAADRPSEATRLPWRIAKSMKEDHVATLAMVHWPDPGSGWYRDFRRVAAYSPVLARWVTASDYFHLTDRPYESFQPDLDQYTFPYLAQAVARRDPTPISRRVVQTALRARLDSVRTLSALCHTLGSPAPDDGTRPSSRAESSLSDATATEDELSGPVASEPPTTSECYEVRHVDTPSSRSGTTARPEADRTDLSEVEDALESGRLSEAAALLDENEPSWARATALGIVGASSGDRPGCLILNPLGVARRAAVLLPDAAADLRPEGPLIAAQFTEDGVRAVVDLPAFGYAWVPLETVPDRAPADTGTVGARGRVLFNEAMEVEIDETTGGIRSLRAPGEPSARIGQQLVINGLTGTDGSDASSTMHSDRFEVEYGGPALVQAVSEGTLRGPDDGRPLARFRQQYRLWRGRARLELTVELSQIDTAWLGQIADADPWACALACRWAWPEADSRLRRTSMLTPFATSSARPETPDALEVSAAGARSTLLFGGLAHHRRHGPRMLDTLLVAGRESSRRFRMGVVLDHDHPFAASQDMLGPVAVVPGVAGPPAPGQRAGSTSSITAVWP